MMLEDLAPTAAERRVIENAATGSPTDFRKPADAVAAGAKWGPNRTVRAEVLIELLTHQGDADRQPRLLSVAGARITGDLALEALTLVRPVVLNDCYFQQPVLLDEAEATRLDFSGCRLPALRARQLQTRGDLTLDRVTETTEIILAGARIGGELGLRNARLAGGAQAFAGHRLEVHVGMDCGEVSVEGQMHLVGAHIRGQLNLSGARLRNPDDTALLGDGIEVDQDLFCRSSNERRFEADGELRLVGGHIGGQVVLRGARLAKADGAALNAGMLRIDEDLYMTVDDDGQRFEADGELNLIGTHVGGTFDMRGAHLINGQGPVLSAEGLTVDQSVYCSGDEDQRFEADGELVLLGGRISGQFDLRGARLSNADGPALTADGLRIDQDLVGRSDDNEERFETNGELRLIGGHVGGQLDLRGAHLSNAGGPALTADGLRVDQELVGRCDDHGQRLETDGELSLVGAHIGGTLDLRGAHLSSDSGDTLSAERLRVDQSMFCFSHAGERFESDGEMDLLGAHIGGELDLTDARLTNTRGPAFVFERGRASRLTLPRLPDRDAVVDLAHAQVSQFYDDPAPAGRGEVGYVARVTGFTYDSLGPKGSDCEARLAWLHRATDGYVPQAYDQLAEAYRRAGQDEDAKKVMIAKQVRRRGTLGRPGKLVSATLGAAVGYGYQTWRAAAALVALVAISCVVFSRAHPDHMTPTRAKARLPDFNALLYSLDAVLPVINLGQEIAWSPQGAAHYWYGASAVVGWLLGLGLVAFLTARFFRE